LAIGFFADCQSADRCCEARNRYQPRQRRNICSAKNLHFFSSSVGAASSDGHKKYVAPAVLKNESGGCFYKYFAPDEAERQLAMTGFAGFAGFHPSLRDFLGRERNAEISHKCHSNKKI
jgi:hypothetical protein